MVELKLNLSFRRIPLILLVLRAIYSNLNDYKSTDDLMECIEIFFSSIPDHFVTKEEVGNLFMMLSLDVIWYYSLYEYTVRCEKIKDVITENFISLFGSVYGSHPTPRSLKHLCRCSLRCALLKAPTPLPISIDQLSKPKPLKKYLLVTPESN